MFKYKYIGEGMYCFKVNGIRYKVIKDHDSVSDTVELPIKVNLPLLELIEQEQKIETKRKINKKTITGD